MTSSWVIRGTGDLNNDGTSDILLHNSSTKRVAYWILNTNGTLRTSGFCNDGTMASGWGLEATGL